MSSEPGLPSRSIGRALAVPGLFALCLAVPNAVAIWMRSRGVSRVTRVLHHVFDAGQLLALGLLFGIVAFAWLRWAKPWRRLWILPLAGVSLGIGALELPTSFDGFAERMSGAVPLEVVLWGLVALGSLTLPVAVWVGLLLSNSRLRYGAAALSLALATFNNLVLDRDYYGLHLFTTLSALGFGSAALSRLRLPAGLTALSRPRVGQSLIALASLGAVLSLTLPSSALWLRLSSLEGAPLARAGTSLRNLFAVRPDAVALLAVMDPQQRQWFESRSAAPAVPAGKRVLPERPIVILLTVDCLRADVLQLAGLQAELPYFRKFAASGVSFDHARSPGSGTATALTSIFSGKHYSQLYWTKTSTSADVWPHEDASVRFPELLRRAGIRTVNIGSKSWLVAGKGVVAGFEEEEDLDQRRQPRTDHVKSAESLPRIQARLENAGDRPIFLYAHIMDPHSPYDYGKVKSGHPRLRYLSEVERLGRHLSEFDGWLHSRGLFERTALIITADHGEAFGEHHTYQHSKTVYEEVIRVPLWMRIPGVKPRQVGDPVSLIDLAPTLLDLFGLETPGSFMGQSLVPYLRGESPELARPIVAEARLLHAMVFSDGYKAIFDAPQGTHELYHLKNDPGEENNLAESSNEMHLLLLKAFFQRQLHPSYIKVA